MENQTNTQTAKERYLATLANKKLNIVEVTAPSGFIFKRIKPTATALFFEACELPSGAADDAVAYWTKLGVGLPSKGVPTNQDMVKKAAEKTIEVTARVCSNSVEPKIVLHEVTNDNEIHYQDIDPEDLEFLYQYEASRGDLAMKAAMFPQESDKRVTTGTNGKKFRAKSK